MGCAESKPSAPPNAEAAASATYAASDDAASDDAASARAGPCPCAVRADYASERAACRYARRHGDVWQSTGAGAGADTSSLARDAWLLRRQLDQRAAHVRAGNRASMLPHTLGTSVADGAQLTVTAPGVPNDARGARLGGNGSDAMRGEIDLDS